MGLTIHYRLNTDRTEIEAIRSLVQEIRQAALQLPFQEVGEIIEFRGDACKSEDRDEPDHWLKIQAGQYVQEEGGFFKVTPLHFIAFATTPGEGCEPANFGLARYPTFVNVGRSSPQRRRTNLTGWSWGSFCKTQYASNANCGGMPNFVRCHLCVIALLDELQKRQLVKVEVIDESDYWTHRDVRKLAEEVGVWNEGVAALVGQFKDGLPGLPIEAPITQFADFEHLEAKGQDTLKPQS